MPQYTRTSGSAKHNVALSGSISGSISGSMTFMSGS